MRSVGSISGSRHSGGKMKVRKFTSAFFFVLFASVTVSTAAPVVIAPGSTVAGKSIGEWTAEWWNWAGRATPSVTADTSGAAATSGQSGPVFFIAGTSGGTVNRTF